MAKFFSTTGLSYRLEELIKNAKEKLILISPYLQLNERLKQILEDKGRLKIDVRLIYGKSELQPAENNSLKELRSIRTSVCPNLHAKCYLSEHEAIITSMSLYEYSQINNNEMGVYIDKTEDEQLYTDVYTEAMRLVRISDEIKVSVPKVLEGNDESTNKIITDFSSFWLLYSLQSRNEAKSDGTLLLQVL